MHNKIAAVAICIASFAMSAAAQTVTGSGTTGTVAVFTGSSTVGSTTTPITVTSAGNVGDSKQFYASLKKEDQPALERQIMNLAQAQREIERGIDSFSH